MLTTLQQLADGTVAREVQNEALVTYAEKLSKEEARLDWQLSAAQLERCIRAFNPWPVSYFTVDDQPVKVWQAQVSDESSNASRVPSSMPTSMASRWQLRRRAMPDAVTACRQKADVSSRFVDSRREWFTPGNRL
ncbi:hypothetical protein [Serratia odorifera]|uniref:hypothetical protein n=1 Tax=Serratia odorifera TaxID=618 RepID=UPI003B9695B1